MINELQLHHNYIILIISGFRSEMSETITQWGIVFMKSLWMCVSSSIYTSYNSLQHVSYDRPRSKRSGYFKL